METSPTPSSEPREIPVWDAIVRYGHWFLVVAFAAAYASGDEVMGLHTLAGYGIAIVIIARVIWGFIGSPHARFSDFVKGPGAVFAYLGGTASGRSPRYIGHNPAGGAMVLALLACLIATTWTGMVVLAQEKHQGPLAPFYTTTASAEPASGLFIGTARADDDHDGKRGHEGSHRESAMEEAHEFFANLMLVLIALHVTGVVTSSLAHRENLVRAMITGRKRA
ncbi:cytochrome b/b6 domain-containing protein [Pararhodospirillum oryzae]|uniref:Cytochrome b561 n=1 Tax=Pararhodospirillum oryzae TaxID=478448 RepID=A0A512HC85_9PROT|nr:cytochrome b/b6 domain-containing protein [Pararhodospirillum oryzae]GEO83010.1 cytochrome b561 [Pararhodospirillum oryzae]